MPHPLLYATSYSPYTSFVPMVKTFRAFSRTLPLAAALSLLSVAAARPRAHQLRTQEPAEKPAPKLPAEIALFETRVRFETDGSSRKEVHALVKINDELGVRQFARLSFDFNRSFQQVEIPLLRITHPSGGVIDVLPSAITEQPNPAVVNAPAYQDVRVKSVRILGLEPGDSLEYRVITTTSDAPLAPDFWLDHTFDRSGVVAKENFEIDLPASLAPPTAHWGDNLPQVPHKVAIAGSGSTPEPFIQKLAEGTEERVLYRYEVEDAAKKLKDRLSSDTADGMGDVELGFLSPWGSPSWAGLSHRLYSIFVPRDPLARETIELARQLTRGAETSSQKSERIYDFVSKKIKTIDLPLGSTGFRLRPAADIAASGYATQEDKVALFLALAKAAKSDATSGVLIGPSKDLGASMARPSAFAHILVSAGLDILDPSVEVAPFRMLPASYRGSEALFLRPAAEEHDGVASVLAQIPKDLPFSSSQRVQLDATIDSMGSLTARAHYTMRGDAELLLRVAFHQTPKEKWKDVAQLLSISDGFRGHVTNVTPSDPDKTRTPFTVQYELTQPKFLDWAKKPVRIPALLPLLGLPEPATRPAAGTRPAPIELGTPLDVEVTANVHLPEGGGAEVPAGTSVERDFATYTSEYSVKGDTITASRHLNFILKEIPADRAADYNAFLQAVQNDESQFFTLERAAPAPVEPKKQ